MVVAGLFIGINNTLITETVMKAAPVERGVASAAYSFLRFGGAAVAPWLAGVLGERFNAHLPFWVGAGAVLSGAAVLAPTRPHLTAIDAPESELDELERRGAGGHRRQLSCCAGFRPRHPPGALDHPADQRAHQIGGAHRDRPEAPTAAGCPATTAFG